jgi:hypothetical protein
MRRTFTSSAQTEAAFCCSGLSCDPCSLVDIDISEDLLPTSYNQTLKMEAVVYYEETTYISQSTRRHFKEIRNFKVNVSFRLQQQIWLRAT